MQNRRCSLGKYREENGGNCTDEGKRDEKLKKRNEKNKWEIREENKERIENKERKLTDMEIRRCSLGKCNRRKRMEKIEKMKI